MTGTFERTYESAGEELASLRGRLDKLKAELGREANSLVAQAQRAAMGSNYADAVVAQARASAFAQVTLQLQRLLGTDSTDETVRTGVAA